MASVMQSNSLSIIDNRCAAFPKVNAANCDLCDGCNAICPTNAIVVDEVRWAVDAPACIGCRLCVVFCPSGALSMASPILPAHIE